MPRVTARALAHALNLATGSYRRTVGALALIRDPRGRILVARPTYPPRIWNLPGGRVERDEAPEAGLVREVLEETGLEVKVERLLLVDVSRRRAVTFTFACSVTGGALVPSPGEIAAVRWIGIEDLPRLDSRLRRTLGEALAAGPAPRYIG